MLKSNEQKIEPCGALYSKIDRLLKQSLILLFCVQFKKNSPKRLCLVSKFLNFLFQSEARNFSRPFLVLSLNNEDCKKLQSLIHTSAKSHKIAIRGFVR